MKRKILSLTLMAGLAIGTLVAVNAENPGGRSKGERGGREHERGGWGNPLERISKELNLTPEQQAKVAPIVDQAKPQIMAIHQDAMQKTKAVIDSSVSQIRPLLTPQQQQKLDAIQKAHEDMRKAHEEMRDARRQ